jgi:hypothetical protein
MYVNTTPMSTYEGLEHLADLKYVILRKSQKKVRAPGFEPCWVASHRTILPLDYKPICKR